MSHIIKKLIITTTILFLPCHTHAGIIDYALPATALMASGFVASSIPAYKEMQKMRALCRRNPDSPTLEAEFNAARKIFITRLSVGGIAGLIAFTLWFKKPPVHTEAPANDSPQPELAIPEEQEKKVPPAPPAERPVESAPDAATVALITTALTENDIDSLRTLKDSGTPFNADNLATAITNGSDQKTLSFLIKECGVDVDGDDSAALKAALKKKDWNAVRLLTDNGASIDVHDEYGRTPLMIAAESDDLTLAKILRDRGADMEEPDRYGNTILHVAAARGSLDFVQFLVNSKATIDARGYRGETPLHAAISRFPVKGRRRIAILKLLLDNGADIHATASRIETEYCNLTPLQAAKLLYPYDSHHPEPAEDDVVWFLENEERKRG